MEDKPIVVLQNRRDRYEYLKDKIMNESMAEVVFSDETWDEETLVRAIASARAMVRPQVVQARKAYVRTYYGTIDGYEEYRLAVQLLQRYTHDDQDMLRDVAGL